MPYPWDHICLTRGTTTALPVGQQLPYPWDNNCLTRGTTSVLPVGQHLPYLWDNIVWALQTQTCFTFSCRIAGTVSLCWLTNARFVKARVTVLSCLIKQRLVFLNTSFFYLKSLHSSDVRLIFFLTPIVNL